MAISQNGAVLRFVTDNGSWIRARPVLNSTGHLIGLKETTMGLLIGANGQPIQRTYKKDAESLFRINGGYVTSFETHHRLLKYRSNKSPFSGRGDPVSAPHHLIDAHRNKGMEAAVALNDGRWVVFAENFPEDEPNLFGWVLQKQRWRPFDYTRTGEFQPSGAALLPSGNVLILERRFSFLGGFGSRLAVILQHDIRPGATLRSQEIARLEPPLVEENFEGAAAYKNKTGETIIYIVSDDNFSPLQSTLLLMFKLRNP